MQHSSHSLSEHAAHALMTPSDLAASLGGKRELLFREVVMLAMSLNVAPCTLLAEEQHEDDVTGGAVSCDQCGIKLAVAYYPVSATVWCLSCAGHEGAR